MGTSNKTGEKFYRMRPLELLIKHYFITLKQQFLPKYQNFGSKKLKNSETFFSEDKPPQGDSKTDKPRHRDILSNSKIFISAKNCRRRSKIIEFASAIVYETRRT